MAELFELTGVDTVRQNLERLAARMLQESAVALQREAKAIYDASQPLVPVDTGSLRASGRVLDAETLGNIVQSGVLYGGLEGVLGRIPQQYAYIVHQDVTMRHPRGGQSHFLSGPTFAATSGMLSRIADQLRNAL